MPGELYFKVPVPKDLICGLCRTPFKNAVQCPREHIFCEKCVDNHFGRRARASCPGHRHEFNHDELSPAPRAIRHMIANLDMVCAYKRYGCKETWKYNGRDDHSTHCPFRVNQLEEELEALMAEIKRLKQIISDAEYAAVAAKRDENGQAERPLRRASPLRQGQEAHLLLMPR